MDNADRDAQRAHQLQFIEQTLVSRILATNGSIANSRLLTAKASLQNQLDGYMSAIYDLQLTTQDANADVPDRHRIIVKLMKGDINFRIASKSYPQFANEVYIYARVLPCFQRLLDQANSPLRIDESWVPKMYYGFFGAVAELSALDESILALQDLRPEQFRAGPPLLLDEPHLRLMLRLIGRYHSLSYALRLRHPDEYRQLVEGIVELSFVPTGRDGDTTNLYTVLYDIALKRFERYMQRTDGRRSRQLRDDVARMMRQYGDRPVELLEKLRRPDDTFAAILHGDFNRNNVLFRYGGMTGHDEPLDVRMIDFQEVRFASPALDLSFVLYMNSDLPSTSAAIWDQLLRYYHEEMINSLATVSGYALHDVALLPYSYDRFLEHFSQFAFYGVLICMQFTPFKLGQDAECDRMSVLFERNMYSAEFRDGSMEIGGEAADERIVGIVEDASARGYMRIFDDADVKLAAGE